MLANTNCQKLVECFLQVSSSEEFFQKILRVACSTPCILNTSAFHSIEKTADDRSYSDSQSSDKTR